MWQVTTLLDTHLLNVRVSALTQCAVLFALGVMAAEAGWDGRLCQHTEHRLGQVTVGGVGLTLVLVSYTGARDQLDMALGGLNWASVSFATLYGVVSIAFTLWCLAWLRRRWPTHDQLMTKYVAYEPRPDPATRRRVRGVAPATPAVRLGGTPESGATPHGAVTGCPRASTSGQPSPSAAPSRWRNPWMTVMKATSQRTTALIKVATLADVLERLFPRIMAAYSVGEVGGP